MADTTALKNRIRAAIKANDNQEITGPVLQQTLLDIVDELNSGTETEASTRSNADATLQQNITTEKNRAEEAESTLQQNIIAERQRAEEAFDDLDMIDAAGSEVSPNAISLTLRKNDGSEEDPEWRTLCQLLIPPVSTERAGLMSVAMRNLLYNLRNAGYAFGGIAVTATNPGVPSGNCFYIVRGAGTYTHFKNADNESIVLENDGIYVLTYESVENQYWEWNPIIKIATGTTDFDNPTSAQRAKILTVGAVLDGLNDGVYDISKRFPTGGPNSDGKFTLDYILTNANTLIPTSWRHGSMSISFVDSSDNKYVQYRLMTTAWSTNVSDWQGVDEEPTAGSRNLVESGGVAESIFYLNGILSLPSYEGYLNEANNNIRVLSQGTYKVIPINGGSRLDFYKGTSASAFALVSEFTYNPTLPYNLVFATSENSVVIPAADSPIINKSIPNDAKYLIIRDKHFNGTDALPSVLKIDGVDLLKGLNEKSRAYDMLKDAGLINVTIEYPLESGYYQITDATAANFAPAAIPESRRVLCTILKIQVATDRWELWYYRKSILNNWLSADSWIKIPSINDAPYNLTEQVPLSSGYYQLNNSSGSNYAPSAVPSYLRKPGFLLIIQTDQYEWKMYQFVGSVSAWSNIQRWERFETSTGDVYLLVYSARATDNDTLSLSISNAKQSDSFVFGVTLGIPVYVVSPKININSWGAKDIYRKDGNKISVLDMRNANKVYFISYDGNDNYTLLNPDNQEDIDLSNMVEGSIKNDLEIGYINSSSCKDGTLNTRLRTKAGIFYKSPLKLKINSGYALNGHVTFNPSTGVSTYNSTVQTGTIEFPSDGLLRRFVFKKSDNSAFTQVEDVASIIIEEDVSNTETLDIASCETLLTIGTSHTEGNGSLKDKAMVSYLGALTDWIVSNQGVSGNNYLKCYYYFMNNSLITDRRWSDIGNGGVCLDFLGGNAENPFFCNPVDGSYSVENMKRLYSAIAAKGFEIIPGSYWGDQSNSYHDIQENVAKELALSALDINADCRRINAKEFLPYWFNQHFATRTVANQFFTLLQKYNIRRPKKSIKIFRNRETVSNNSELLYNDYFERLKKWREISVYHRCLSEDKYVDRIDLFTAEGKTQTTVSSEYNTFQSGTALSFADKALVEFILPATAYNLSHVKLHLTLSANNANVYVRKYKDSSLAIPVTPTPAIFIIDGGVSGISVGDVFTDSLAGNSGVTFTVTSVNSDGGYIMCSASGVYVTPGMTSDTLTRASDSATFTATSLTSGVPEDYLSRALESYGKWELLTAVNGVYSIESLDSYMEFDKITILIDNSSTPFTMSDCYLTYNKMAEKECGMTISERYPVVLGNSVLEDEFNNSVGTYTNTHGSYIWDGNESYVDSENNTVTKNHIPIWYKQNPEYSLTKILHLKKDDILSYFIDGFNTKTLYDSPQHFRLTIVARYFPASNLDVSANNFTVTQNSFDFTKIGIRYNIGQDAQYIFTDERYVPSSFVEIQKDIYLDAKHTGKALDIVALGDDLEILYVKMVKC